MFLGLSAFFICLASTSLALMPPHVTGTNIKGGVLDGNRLVIDGYSLGYADFKTEFSLSQVKTGNKVRHERKLTCKMEGDCKTDRDGSCQERCKLAITLKGVQSGAALELRFLELKTTFSVKRASKTVPTKR